eukprot:CAMPEP_0203671766 /NCGR_PEP_ID=MMETSP0090-20130426/7456_1 /ASSEMBLY_ACC=CAM_ASM_001088 /TAXON_ID=426623 /ORGANISM="Chaetoceros affinis, Strain CCMP159" /LENGTH=331 /DNA_ID=CAMNT_0050536905 /DNA_START=318 /DNA_END=1313 /DNA_ORIENTATION=-
MNYSGGEGESGGDDAMRRAFEQFMLQGKSKKNNKNSNVESTTINTEQLKEVELQKKQKEINHLQQEINKSERKYWSIFHRFCNILQNQWMDIDDQTFQVVNSISGIRHRIPMQVRLIKHYQETEINVENGDWKFQGYNQTLFASSTPLPLSSCAHHHQLTRSTLLLQREDIESALSHDLNQHETMMEGLRSLFSNLAEMHDSLSRALDEMMKYHLQQEEVTQNYNKHYTSLSWTPYQKASQLVGLMNDLFQMLSLELYRKQMLANLILDSANDRILLSQQEDNLGSHSGDDLDDSSPGKIVKYCLDCWLRSCDQSCIDTGILDFVISLHER